MNSEASAFPDFLPAQRLCGLRFRPRLVFAADNCSGAGKCTAGLLRVMIVEDDYLVSSEMERALIGGGFAVVGVASSAEEAIAIAATERPVIAVMDVRLGRSRDGIDAALELFRTQGIRSVFATAHNDAEVRERAKPANPLGWLQKPYTMRSLVEMVRNAARDLQGKDRKI